MLPVLYGHLLIRKMFGIWPNLHVRHITRQQETSGSWFTRDWLVTLRQSLRLKSCGIVLKLHGHLNLYMPSNRSLTQFPGI
ncbi:hypothetical protein TNCV_190241 [Trichonephila clavipes]|nr:hypothetical protein TNCV_190241 [Trichonephila clavipes]